jgi:hypothetical protein
MICDGRKREICVASRRVAWVKYLRFAKKRNKFEGGG